MRKALGGAVLLLALTVSAYAGEIPNPAPTPPQQIVAEETTADGEIPNPRPEEEASTAAVLTFLESVLALF
jgi:hypothetical protein